jgi:hypothetical protein
MARAIGLMRIAAMGTTRPDHLLERINAELCVGNDTSMFMSIFCGFFEVASGRLTYSNGGHCAPVLMRRDGASRLPLPKGVMAGAAPGLRYAAREIVLERGGAGRSPTGRPRRECGGEEFRGAPAEIVERNAGSPLEALLDRVRRRSPVSPAAKDSRTIASLLAGCAGRVISFSPATMHDHSASISLVQLVAPRRHGVLAVSDRVDSARLAGRKFLQVEEPGSPRARRDRASRTWRRFRAL